MQETTETEANKPYPDGIFVCKPEGCMDHRFAVDLENKTNFKKATTDDDDRCIHCGLYFSTWVWYSNEITKSFRKGIDSGTYDAIILLAAERKAAEEVVQGWAARIIEKLEARRRSTRY